MIENVQTREALGGGSRLRIIISKITEAWVMACVSLGSLFVIFGLKEMPSTLVKAFTYGNSDQIWIWIMAVSSVAGLVGTIMRSTHNRVTRYTQVGLGLEFIGYLGSAGMVLIYGGATVLFFGPIDGAISYGIAFACSAYLIRRWIFILLSLREARTHIELMGRGGQ